MAFATEIVAFPISFTYAVWDASYIDEYPISESSCVISELLILEQILFT